jgi:hypothetical protein
MRDPVLFAVPSDRGRPRSRMYPKVRDALAQAKHLEAVDDAAAQLALRLALDIDGIDLGDRDAVPFEGKLLDVLRELGMTPRARRLGGLDTPADGGDPLAELRPIRDAFHAAAADSGP